MTGPVPGIPAQRAAAEAVDPADPAPIPLAELISWHQPGVHRVRLANREVWVRMDERGIASVSSAGPEQLASPPLG
jgi:hypothetical protein